MENFLIACIAAAFVGMLAVNIYFRAQVLKAYRKLERAGVQFDAQDMLSAARIEELTRQHPGFETEIRTFTEGIRRSMSMASALIVLITLLGATLMWYR